MELVCVRCDDPRLVRPGQLPCGLAFHLRPHGSLVPNTFCLKLLFEGLHMAFFSKVHKAQPLRPKAGKTEQERDRCLQGCPHIGYAPGLCFALFKESLLILIIDVQLHSSAGLQYIGWSAKVRIYLEHKPCQRASSRVPSLAHVCFPFTVKLRHRGNMLHAKHTFAGPELKPMNQNCSSPPHYPT